ncbi:sensor histidine kinase [Streptomyces sp. NPDC050418]|uniref:sensor histidine kinase n=1 Tax=Streptomyces sp. NPDC050418 TaxID=3365612 RepID=UPI00379795B2
MFSIHGRLFAGFATALGLCAALMVAVIYVGMRYVPTYDLTTPVRIDPSSTPLPEYTPAKPVESADPGQKFDTRAITSKEDVWNTVLVISIGGVLVVGTLGLTAGWFLSKRLLAPLHTINDAARKAAGGNLSGRIAAQGPPDELHQLADTFDEMLARLEESFAAHQRFAANASHELLTPLATTRAALQVAGDAPTREELAELLPMLRETNERGIAIVSALLGLASAGNVPFDPEPVDLSRLATAAAAERADRASSYVLRLDTEIEPQVAVTGSTTLLRQLLLNLLDNALTHNVPDGSVHLALFGTTDQSATGPDQVVVEITNTGPHVPESEVDRLFEPFHRADSSRIASDRSGHGLGLPLIRSITAAHHGTLDARPNPTGGLTIRITLPRA